MHTDEAGRARAPGPTGSPRAGWWAPALAGAAAFWLANLAVSLTPVAASYRSALSIPYVPMLVEAAAGGLVVATAVAFSLARFGGHLPGRGPLGRSLALTLAALVLLTVLLGVPSTLGAHVTDARHWLLVGTGINVIRLLALGVAVGLAARARTTPLDHDRHHDPVARRRAPS